MKLEKDKDMGWVVKYPNDILVISKGGGALMVEFVTQGIAMVVLRMDEESGC